LARCAYCETETELYEGSTPICVPCAETSSKRFARAKLFHDLHEATKRAEAATDAFALVSSQIPSGIPHPDDVQLIHNASHEMTAARDDLMRAHNRLNDFLDKGIVPDDLI
jgi:penicillin V acylase-like amidase (Ntn superfamily)